MDKIKQYTENEKKLAEILLELFCENKNLPEAKSLQDWWYEAPKGTQLKMEGKVVATKE